MLRNKNMEPKIGKITLSRRDSQAIPLNCIECLPVHDSVDRAANEFHDVLSQRARLVRKHILDLQPDRHIY